MKHLELCELGAKFCKNYGCSVILQEFVSTHSEQPDVMAWKSGHSLMIEAKTSRQDFLKDAEKYSRRRPDYGLGNYRFYICRENLIGKEELPDGWGLIYVDDNGKLKTIIGPDGNYISPIHCELKRFQSNIAAENNMLVSALRKIKKTEIKNRNYKVYYLEENTAL